MDHFLVPSVLFLVAVVVAWVLYDQRYGYRRQLAAIRRHQGDGPVEEIEETARHLIAEGWNTTEAYARAIEKRVQVVNSEVKVETARRVRSSSLKAVKAHDEIEKTRTAAHKRILVKHADGIIPGQGPANRPQTPFPEPRAKK